MLYLKTNQEIVRLLFLLEYYPIGLIRILNISSWVLFQKILYRDFNSLNRKKNFHVDGLLYTLVDMTHILLPQLSLNLDGSTIFMVIDKVSRHARFGLVLFQIRFRLGHYVVDRNLKRFRRKQTCNSHSQ